MCLSPFNNEVYITNHGAKGGDWFGKVNHGGNYGWDKLYWGGTKYSGLKGGPKWLPGYDKPIKYYVPSIAIISLVKFINRRRISRMEWKCFNSGSQRSIIKKSLI